MVPLQNVHYSYGFGVYENIRVSKGRPLFLEEHCERLLNSAKIIDLPHGFETDFISKTAKELIAKNNAEGCNLKILLVGGKDADSANLYMICLNPLFPDRKLYKEGAHTITKNLERQFPQAKTLNMLPSYLAYREASAAGAYDALLINDEGNVTEGTRSNFFTLKGKTICSPKESDILLGVTRHHVIETAKANGFEVVEKDIPLNNLQNYDAAFLTSTSSKIVPVRTIDELTIQSEPTPELQELMRIFDSYLS